MKKLEITFKNRLVGGALVVSAAFLWSLDGVFFRPQLYEVDVLAVVFIEHLFGFIILCPFIFLYFKEIRQLDKKEWLALLWVSLFGGLIGTYAITQAFFAAFAGVSSIAAVIIVQKLQPVFALLLSRLVLKERLKKEFYLWAILAVFSSYALVFNNDFSIKSFFDTDFFNSPGLMALIAAFAFGSSTVFGKRLVNHLNFRSSAALRLGLTAGLSLILVLLFGKFVLLVDFKPTELKILIIIALLTGAVATSIYYQGLKRISASLATILELFWPISAIALDYFVNKVVLSPIQIISAILLLVFVFRALKTGRLKFQEFVATVIDGEKIGTSLGFPTINLNEKNINIAHGVYLVNAEINSQNFQALMHFGPKKTLSSKISLELYLKEKIEKLPQTITIKPKKRLRGIIKFKNKAELVKKIKEDVAHLN